MNSMGHPLFWLAILTFLIVIGVGLWSYASTKRRQIHGSQTRGIGGDKDPMA